MRDRNREQIRQEADLYAEHILICRICSQPGAMVCAKGLELLEMFQKALSMPDSHRSAEC